MNSRSDHQNSRFFRLLHVQLCAGSAFNLAGVCQPGLFQLQPAPFGYRIILLGFKCAQLDRQVTALMT